ncbi:carbohydrate ABC transporter substrate-binding protein [Paenibacillus mesophilus]|uniref:ABC transporter substrate-binding protein n=1 Tax=Paenibacillus mesophilus TaxID=2582849 RepID=UPI00110E0B98|nr:ABC transporter substrate-binding protein [Paenibacillus mesophilus]TMV51367.1 carbohydrate ABC transporter substrate-binding protein [Paenibacillus mesophilus]
MFKKRMMLLLACMVTAGSLAACSNGGGDGKAGEPSGDKGTTAKDITKDPAEVVFYSNNGDPVESFDYRFGNSLRKKFPNWTIKYIQRAGTGTNLDELLANGTKFDIFFQSIGNFEAQAFPAGIQYDMTELIKSQKVDLSRLDQSVVDAVKQASGGKLYGLPIFTSNLVTYYNKTLFDKFGVPYIKDGITWTEMVETSKRLTRLESGMQYFGFTHSPAHTMRMNPLSIPNVDLASETPTINKDDRWKKYFQTYYLEPMRVPGYLDGMKKINKIPDINMFVKDQNVGMYGYLSSLIYVWEQELKSLNWDIVSFPTVDKGIGSQSYPSYFGMTNMVRNKEATMEVLKYMISDEFQSEMARKGIMPVLSSDAVKKELGKDSPYKDRNWNAVFYNKFAPIPAKAPYDAEMVNQYVTAGNNIALDKMDINTALRSADEAAVKKVQEYKSKNK